MNARVLDPTLFTGQLHVLACDPGKTTGWANLAWQDDIPVFNAGELETTRYLDWIAQMLSSRDVVVCEAFIITPRTAKLSQQTDALETIGALRWLCHDRGATFDIRQKAGDATSFDPKGAKLKQLGMWPTSSDHAQMAARHLLLACVHYKVVDLRRLVIG